MFFSRFRLVATQLGAEMASAGAEPQPGVALAGPTKRAPSEEMAVSSSRTVTEEASRVSSEHSHLHRTPPREEDDKRVASSSDCGEGPGPHNPPSEGATSSAESSPQAEHHLLSQTVEGKLREFLYAWGKRLVELQPKVHMSDHLIESGLFLFKCLRQLQLNACCEGSLALTDLSNEVLLLHDLIACFWIAMKQCSVRTQVPNRTLVSKATGAQPELLGQRELAALLRMNWGVNSLLKYGGFIAGPEPDDEAAAPAPGE